MMWQGGVSRATRTLFSCVVGSLILAVGVPDLALAAAGRTTAVRPDARGTPPGQVMRVLVPKLDVFENERIQTNEHGVTQILFVDGGSLTVGPNSDLLIDRFVYDPETSTGELAAKLGRGLLRFVGGRISKREAVTISTPAAVIGVRGGIAVVEHREAGGTEATFLFGREMTVTGLGPDADAVRVTRPGFTVPVAGDGRVATAVRTDAAKLDASLGALEGGEGSDGGAPAPPTDETVRASAYVAQSSAAPAAPDPSAQGALTRGPGSRGEATEEAATTASDDGRRDAVAVPGQAALLRYRLTENLAETLGLPSIAGTTSGYPLTIVKGQGSFEDLAAERDTQPQLLWIRNRVEGRGRNQKWEVLVGVGATYLNRRALSLIYGGSVRYGTGRDDALFLWGSLTEDRTPLFRGTAPPEDVSLASGFFRPDDESFRAFAGRARTTTGTVFGQGDVSGRLRFDEAIPLDRAGPRGDRVWRGYATGLFESRTRTAADANYLEGVYSLRNRNDSPDDVMVFAHASSNDLGARFDLGGAMNHEGDQGDQGDQARMSDNSDVGRIEFNFGYRRGQPVPTQVFPGDSLLLSRVRGTYIDDDAFGATGSVIFLNRNVDGDPRVLVYVNGGPYPRWRPTQIWMFSNAAAPVEGLLPRGVTYCDCPAAKFGWWGALVRTIYRSNGAETRWDSSFPGTFVVGDLPEIADIPAVGEASYAGHAAAAIRSGGVPYAAVGRFSMDWNFATRRGAARIDSLDGRNYAAPLRDRDLPRDFSGQLVQAGGSATGTLTGSFFTDGTDPVKDVGGKFVVEDTGYVATGSFAATR